MSFEEFEEITDTKPEKYINNPDSFLNSINLKPTSKEDEEIYAYGLVYMAYNLREQGNIFKSIQYYERVLNFVQNKQVENIDIPLYILKPLAALYINVNDNQKAISLLEKFIQSIPKAEYSAHIGFINNLANAYLYNSEMDKAIALISTIIPDLKSSIDKAMLYNTISKAYDENDEPSHCDKYNQLALAEFKKFELQEDTLVWYCSALTQYAALHQSSEEALEALQILNTNFPNSQYRNKANASLIVADIYYNKKEYNAAQKYYILTYQNFKKGSNKYLLDYKYTYSLLGIAKTYKSKSQVDSALYYYEWAIENDFRTQQLISSETDQLRNNIWNKANLEEIIQLYNDNPKLQTSANRATIMWCIELSKARLLINEINRSDNWLSASDEVKNNLKQIRNLYQQHDASESEAEKKAIKTQISELKNQFQLTENYFETINFNPSKSIFLSKLKEQETAFYSYYTHKDKSISIVFTHGKDFIYQKIQDSHFLDSLNHFKKDYFSLTPNTFNNNPHKYIQRAQFFAEQLLPKLSKDQQNVFLSLDGSLYGLPFDALYKQDFLIKNHNIAYLNSFLLFEFITNNARTTSKEIALLYRSEFPKPLPHLEFVQQEVENLTAKFKTNAIAPEHQNDSTIRDAFSQSNIIHIAAHTILDTVEAPYLYLHQAISTNQLRFYDIKTPLVFLSACNTGSGVALPSEGTESIQRVFMSKNVPSVISTYWFANDEVMLQLTSNFYDELNNSESPMLALAQAKRNFLEQASVQQQNPWYWANINYTGIGNEVGLKNSSNLPIVILEILLLSMVIIGIRKIYLGRIKKSYK